MLTSESMALIWSSDFVDGIEGLAVAALIVLLVILWYAREGRNSALEQILMQSEFGSTDAFRGSLAVEEHRPGSYLRLSKSPAAAGVLQFYYRWLVGVGRQAVFDEVAFDRSRRLVEWQRKNKQTTAVFSEFSAVRMREIAGKSRVSLWHVELVAHKAKALPFVTSESGDRRTMFEQTAPLAKAVSAIMEIPVQVFVAGNVWTPGWPPKNPIASS